MHEPKHALTNPLLGIVVVDVREPAEYTISHLPGTTLIPLGELPERLSELTAAQTIYLLCKSGVQSLKAVAMLKSRGFKAVKSVKGGLDAWSAQIDPQLPTY